MPLLQINAVDDRPVIDGVLPLRRILCQQIDALPEGAPIVVLLHGYKFSPFCRDKDPHKHILSLFPPKKRRVVSWPRHLGFGRGNAAEGLCIAFGWQANGHFWRAYRQAGHSGNALAHLLALIAEITDRPVHMIAHSLGARVALRGIAQAARANVGRVVLMAAAEFQAPAARALSSDVGRRAEFINITSRENDFFDMLVERLIHPMNRKPRALGSGMNPRLGNWLDLQIDNGATRQGLANLGFRIAAPMNRVCHWSGYSRPGLLPLYSALIRKPDQFPLEILRGIKPARVDPRWSRLIQLPKLSIPLPFVRKTSF